MANKTMVFVRQLDTLSKAGDKFSLVSLSMHLTFDIIGSVIMDVDLRAQDVNPSQRSELVRSFTELLDAYWDDQIHIPWWLKIRTVLRRRRLGRRVERILKSIIRRKYEEQQANSDKNHDHQLSILSQSLQNTKILSQDILDLTCDQLKTFLLAGHDTPSATIAWIFYELSRNPRVLSAVRSELDDIFGPGIEPGSVYAQLVSPAGADLMGKMLYIMAVIKEILRLHTPASTARYAAAGTGLTVRTPTGDELCVDDMVVYNCSAIIHRDPAIYGDTADHFVPERWLSGTQSLSRSDQHASTTPIPCGAWRPFERGPRGCIGQEFASIEIRVFIAMIARRYEFTKVGIGELVLTEEDRYPVLGDDGRYKVRSH
ncbi:cytochrome P450, partial [Nemania serpens]